MLRRSLLVAVVVVVSALGWVLLSDRSPDGGGEADPPTTPRTTAARNRPAANALGRLSRLGGTPECLPGFGCTAFSVTCPDVARSVEGTIATREPAGVARGTVVFLSGGTGTAWWASRSGGAAQALERLLDAGYRVAQVRWSTPWMAAAPGEGAGAQRLACRPATVLESIRASSVPAVPGANAESTCGFCVVGSSAGAIAAVAALTAYDVGIDHLVAISGPGNFAVDAGCLREPGSEELWYGPEAELVDLSHGAEPGEGPCTARDTTQRAHFAANNQPDPPLSQRDKIVVFLGGADRSAAAAHARRWVARSGVRSEVIEDMPHTLQRSAAGLQRLLQQLGA